MKFYEITFILRQDVQPQEVDAKIAHFMKIIEDNGGSLLQKEYWGLRSLAYEVRKNKKGHYVLAFVEASNEALEELKRQLKITEDVIKWLIFSVKQPETGPSFIMQSKNKYEKEKAARAG